MKSLILMLLMFAVATNFALARVEVKQFENLQQEQRYKKLIDELRCLVCQNQNLADSNADLAQDLRKQVYNMIIDGKSDAAILEYMVSRYGDFVLYRPPFKAITFLLWVGPFIILVAGLFLLIRFIRLRKKNIELNLNDSDKAKVRKLLDENGESE